MGGHWLDRAVLPPPPPPGIYIARGRFWWILTHKSGVSTGTMYNKAAHGFTVIVIHEHGGHQ